MTWNGKEVKTGKAMLYPHDISPKHYSQFKIEPFRFIHENGLGFAEGNVVKYVCRWRDKGGVDDLIYQKSYKHQIKKENITTYD